MIKRFRPLDRWMSWSPSRKPWCQPGSCHSHIDFRGSKKKGDGSKATINVSGMNIHVPAISGFLRCQAFEWFWSIICESAENSCGTYDCWVKQCILMMSNGEIPRTHLISAWWIHSHQLEASTSDFLQHRSDIWHWTCPVLNRLKNQDAYEHIVHLSIP